MRLKIGLSKIDFFFIDKEDGT